MRAILALETGRVFEGESIGASGSRVGEVIFNTSMTGYQEILTDPSYSNQFITFTYPHIGNTGINSSDVESNKIWAHGIIIKKLSSCASNWRSEISLADYLCQHDVVGISGVDTRSLTHVLRDRGALKACIMTGSANEELAISSAKNYSGLLGANLTDQVTTAQTFNVSKKSHPNIIVMDFGVKFSIIKCLEQLGCNITVVSAHTSVQKILAMHPDGILLSNGPGDPSACEHIIRQVKILLDQKIPILGICLGYQILALALGAQTYKMKFGHHGANHPVQDLFNKKVYVTSQNHGFAVDEGSLPKNLLVTHRSLFDQTLQGIRHKDYPYFGFQGHPEAGPGPHDAREIFSMFMKAIKQ